MKGSRTGIFTLYQILCSVSNTSYPVLAIDKKDLELKYTIRYVGGCIYIVEVSADIVDVSAYIYIVDVSADIVDVFAYICIVDVCGCIQIVNASVIVSYGVFEFYVFVYLLLIQGKMVLDPGRSI